MERLERHLILVGLPGAGKSTVGQLLADMLGAEVRDIDTAVETRAGMTVAEIFARSGETEFRELERIETSIALEGRPAIIIPGGGWAAQPGNVEAARGRGLLVYLETSPRIAAARAVPQGGRPLLDHVDPVERMRALLAERCPYYETCDIRLLTDDKTPDQVARELMELARQGGAG